MTIRAYEEIDTDALAELEKESFAAPWPRESFLEELHNPSARFFVAVEGKDVAGYIGAWKILDEYDIANVAVRAQYRRSGVARSLLSHLLEQAKAESIQAVTLEVRVSNSAAIELYRSFRFQTEGVRRKYYLDGEDALIMWLRKDRDI